MLFLITGRRILLAEALEALAGVRTLIAAVPTPSTHAPTPSSRVQQPAGTAQSNPPVLNELIDRIQTALQLPRLNRTDDLVDAAGVGRIPIHPRFHGDGAGAVLDLDAVKGVAAQVGRGDAEVLFLPGRITYREDLEGRNAQCVGHGDGGAGHRCLRGLMRFGDTDLAACEQGARAFQHAHELEHEDVGVGAQDHGEAGLGCFERGAGGQLDEDGLGTLAEAGDAADLAAGAGVHDDGARLGGGGAGPWGNGVSAIRGERVEQFGGELAGARDEDLHGCSFGWK